MFRVMKVALLFLSLGAPALAQEKRPVEGIPLNDYIRTWPELNPCVVIITASDLVGAHQCLGNLIHEGVATAGAYNLKAQLLREAGDLDKAAEVIEQAIRLEGDRDLHYFQKAAIALTRVTNSSNLLSRWKWASATYSAFEKAFELNPRGYPYRRYIAIHKLRAPAVAGGDKEGALAMADEGIRLGVDECYVLRGYASLILERHEVGFADFDKAITLQVFDAQLFAKAGQKSVELNDWSRAEKYFQYIVEKEPKSAYSHFSLGDYYSKRGDFVKAAAALESALKIDPGYQAAANQLAEIRKRP